MTLDVTVDPAGFPLVWVNAINGYVGWLPVTKIQLEYFLSATNDTTFDESWYYVVTGYNPRISLGQVNGKNLFQTLVTGILPNEGRRYALWCGAKYDLLNAQEWGAAYDELQALPASPDYVRELTEKGALRERPKRLIETIAQVTSSRATTLADQMLMRGGVIEYVYESVERNSYTGQGVPHSELAGSFRRPKELVRLNNPNEGARMKEYGLRVIHRGRAAHG